MKPPFRWSDEDHDIMCLAAAHDRRVVDHLLDEQITFCVVAPADVNPRWHLVVDCLQSLVELAQRALSENGMGRTCYRGPDAVLVICPIQ